MADDYSEPAAPAGEATDPEQHATIREMQARVDASAAKWKEQFKEIKRLREFIAGEAEDVYKVELEFQDEYTSGKKDWHMANIVYATCQGLLPLLYAKDPEVAVKPTKQVNPDTTSYTVSSQFSETLELVLNRTFLEAGLKAVAKQAITETQISSVSVAKVSYQSDFYRDPIIANRIDDLQAKLAQVRGRAQKLDTPNLDEDDAETTIELMENEIAALEQQVEQPQAEGLVIDPIMIDDFRMDPQVDTLRQYKRAGWIAHCSWMTPDGVRTNFATNDRELDQIQKYQRDVNGIPQRMGEETDNREAQGEAIKHDSCILPIWELWDKTTMTVYTWGQGSKQWLRDPWQPQRMGQRWYPFFLLGFNWLDSSAEWPKSDVSMLENLGREYDSIRKQGFEHRKLSVPRYIGNRGAINDREDIKEFAITGLGGIILIETNNQPVNEVIQPAVPPPYNPQIYDTTQIRTDMEWISGLGDAQRGGVLRSKTATEATIQQGGLTARMDEKRDQLEDWLTDMSKFAAEVLILSMSLQKAQRIAGPAAFWPQMDRETLYTMVEVEIKAGSTGKPDKSAEREQWIALLPEIKENIQLVMQMRAQGVPDKENPWIQLLQETLSRFDENIDLEKFLPGEPVAEQPQPMQGQVGPQGATPEEMAQQDRQEQAQGQANGQGNGEGMMSPEEIKAAQLAMQDEQRQQQAAVQQQQQEFSQQLAARKAYVDETKTAQQMSLAERQQEMREAESEEKRRQMRQRSSE